MFILFIVIYFALLIPILKDAVTAVGKWVILVIFAGFAVCGPIAIYNALEAMKDSGPEFYYVLGFLILFVVFFLYLIWTRKLRDPIKESTYNIYRDAAEDAGATLEVDLGAYEVEKVLKATGLVLDWEINQTVDYLFREDQLRDFYLEWDDSYRLYKVSTILGKHLVCDLNNENPVETVPKREYWQNKISTRKSS